MMRQPAHEDLTGCGEGSLKYPQLPVDLKGRRSNPPEESLPGLKAFPGDFAHEMHLARHCRDSDPRLDSSNPRYKVGGRYHPVHAPTTNATAAYVYFRPENGSYAGKGWDADNDSTTEDIQPLRDGNLEDASGNRPWINPQSCQILCGGLDGIMGTGTDFPEGTGQGAYTAYDNNRWDDQANFTKGTFEDARE